ncbi:MAG: cyclophilin-like fold protein [Nitrospiraceae bacterium]|nr:cyclophilin-like fold protein [Nitrospiraceae bacterium]
MAIGTGMKVKIRIGPVSLDAQLLDTETARAVYDLLPIEGFNNVWGGEFYFEIPLYIPADTGATCNVNVGDIGYWPPGKAIAIFFGPTPLSGPDGKPVPASDVNLIGKVTGDVKELARAKDFNPIIIEKIKEE